MIYFQAKNTLKSNHYQTGSYLLIANKCPFDIAAQTEVGQNIFIYFYLKLIFFYVLHYFNVLISKINFKDKKYIFNIFTSEKYFKK
jgi:hypothetical protein